MSKEAEAKYKKKAMKTISVSLHREKDKDIIDWYEGLKDKRQTMISILRKEAENE